MLDGFLLTFPEYGNTQVSCPFVPRPSTHCVSSHLFTFSQPSIGPSHLYTGIVP